MENILPAYKSVGENRYRETSGLYWEDFQPGDVFEHRPGRTVLDAITRFASDGWWAQQDSNLRPAD